MKKKKYIVIGLLLIIGLAVGSYFYKSSQKPKEQEKAEIKMGSIKNIIEETGTVYSKRVNSFYSDMSQIVEVLNVSVGDLVKKGDIILTYKNNIDLEIEKAKKQLEVLNLLYNETAKGADFEEISNIKLTINTIKTQLSFANNHLEKTKNLYSSNAVSKVEYEEAENSVLILENQLQEAKNNYTLLIKGVSNNVKKQYEVQVEEVLLQIKILEERKNDTSITAEFDGVITELNVNQSGMTKPGVVVIEIQDPNNLGIFVELLAEEADKIKKDMIFLVKNKNTEEDIYNLKVDNIYPKAILKISELGVEQKRIRVESNIEENKNNLKIGTEVDVEIVLEEKSNVLLIEKDAIYETPEKKYVTVINGGKVEEKEIMVGLKDDKYIEVLEGIALSDLVIINK